MRSIIRNGVRRRSSATKGMVAMPSAKATGTRAITSTIKPLNNMKQATPVEIIIALPCQGRT